MQSDQKNPSVDPSTISSKAKLAFLWLGSTTLVWQLISWALTLITARLLLPEDYGLIALVETVTPYLALVATLNITTWMIQVKDFEPEQQSSAFTLVLILGSLMTLLSFLLAPYVAEFYGRPELKTPFQLVSITFILRSLYALPDSLLRREMKFKAISLLNMSIGITRSLLTLALAYAGYGYWALIWGLVYREALMTVCLFAVKRVSLRLSIDSNLYRSIVKFGGTATLATIAWIIFSTADKVVIGRLFGAEVLGFYAMAFYLTELPMSKVNSVIRPVLLPYFSQLRESTLELQRVFLRIASAYLGLVLPILFGIALVAEEGVPLVLGEKWLPMVRFLQVICFASVLRALLDVIAPLLVASGRPEKELHYNLLQVLVLPASFVLLGKHFGINGVFFVWLVIFPALSFYLLRILHSVIGVSPAEFLCNLKAPVYATLAMTFSVLFFAYIAQSTLSPVLLLTAKILVGAVAYCGAYAMWGKADYALLRQMLKPGAK